MTEYSYFWKGSDGDASLNPYSSDNFSDFIRKAFEADRTKANVLRGYLNGLEVSNPFVLNVRIGSGAALVDGKLYVNDADIDNSLVQPGSGTDYYLVVLRKDFTTNTVAVVFLNQNGSYPSLTQTDGVTWEVELARFTLDNAGVISAITDKRFTAGVNRNRGVLHVNSRGDSRYKVQLGVVRWTGSATSGNVTVTFQYAYDSTPLVICTHYGNYFVNCVVQPTTSNVVVYWKDIDGTTRTAIDIAWIAIGGMVRN